jgi:hypothetical protein
MKDILKIDVKWFKSQIEPLLTGYNIRYSSFKNGDFGDLDRIEFEYGNIGWCLDFWSKDCFGCQIFNFKLEESLRDVLLLDNEYLEKLKFLKELEVLIKTLNDECFKI